jgi:uncharacterized protein
MAMEIPNAVFIVAPAVATLAYVVVGITGFGATILIVPVLALLLPIRFVVPMCLALDLCAFLLLRARTQGRPDAAEVRWLLPFMLAGMAAGAFALLKTPEALLMLILGLFVAGYGLANIVAPGGKPRMVGRALGMPIGFLGGVASSLYGTGGPIYSIYIVRRITDAGTLRATMSAMIALAVAIRLVMFAATGLLFQAEIAWFGLALLPFMWGGLMLGMRLHDRLDGAQVRRAIHYLLLVSGSALIVRALAAIA